MSKLSPAERLSLRLLHPQDIRKRSDFTAFFRIVGQPPPPKATSLADVRVGADRLQRRMTARDLERNAQTIAGSDQKLRAHISREVSERVREQRRELEKLRRDAAKARARLARYIRDANFPEGQKEQLRRCAKQYALMEQAPPAPPKGQSRLATVGKVATGTAALSALAYLANRFRKAGRAEGPDSSEGSDDDGGGGDGKRELADTKEADFADRIESGERATAKALSGALSE